MGGTVEVLAVCVLYVLAGETYSFGLVFTYIRRLGRFCGWEELCIYVYMSVMKPLPFCWNELNEGNCRCILMARRVSYTVIKVKNFRKELSAGLSH